MAIDSVSGVAGVSELTNDAVRTVLVAARAQSQVKQDGANALKLIAGAAAPPTGDHRGQLVNVLA